MLLITCLQLECQENYGKSCSIKRTLVVMEVCNVMMNSKELFATTEYLNL
jgi:hypothetical protein